MARKITVTVAVGVAVDDDVLEVGRSLQDDETIVSSTALGRPGSAAELYRILANAFRRVGYNGANRYDEQC
jgi:hypothetical protein